MPELKKVDVRSKAAGPLVEAAKAIVRAKIGSVGKGAHIDELDTALEALNKAITEKKSADTIKDELTEKFDRKEAKLELLEGYWEKHSNNPSITMAYLQQAEKHGLMPQTSRKRRKL